MKWSLRFIAAACTIELFYIIIRDEIKRGIDERQYAHHMEMHQNIADHLDKYGRQLLSHNHYHVHNVPGRQPHHSDRLTSGPHP